MPIYALGDQVPEIHPEAYIHPEAVVIGDVTIGAESSVWAGAVLRGDDGSIRIGRRTSIQDCAVVHTTEEWPTLVGDEVTIGHLAHLEGCTIHDRALVGTGAVVLHRAVIHSEALVAANAVVLGDVEVPSRALAVGTPATIKPDAVDVEHMMTGMQSYVDRGRRFRAELRRLD
ncbi:MAG: gamma carbonic anhydrase family protein [Acidimicrobiia bacterium]|nr:gamma carbonic anhydrase family protein [Acidimicrobiia bacterium]